MTVEIVQSIDSDASVQAVWSILAALGRHADWVDVSRVAADADEGEIAGGAWRVTIAADPRHSTLTVDVEGEGRAVTHTVRVVGDAHGVTANDQAQLCYSLRFDPVDGWSDAAMAHEIVAVVRRMRGILDALRCQVEGRASLVTVGADRLLLRLPAAAYLTPAAAPYPMVRLSGERRPPLQLRPAGETAERGYDGYLSPLTTRELEILGLLDAQMSNKEIAYRLCISPITVRNHVVRICDKLGVRGRRAAVAQAQGAGLLPSSRQSV